MDTQSSNDALRILIVDADPHDAALAALVLTHGLPQARIEEVSSAPRFTQVLAGGRYDIVVVDPTVPWADAGGVLQTLQACQPDAAVVVLTRTGDAGSAVEALRAGASDYLIKGSESWLRLPIAVRAARYRGRPAAREIEQLRRQVAALEAANRGLAEFPLTAAHELDAPLRLVDRQLAELQRVAEGLDEEARQALGSAADGIRRMQDLVDTLLTYARLGAGRPELTACDCNELVERATAQVLADPGTADATIRHDRLPTVKGDAGQQLLLFRNLLANAVKFRTEKSPRVLVSARAGTGEVVFSVRDNGIGIDAASAKRLFGMFQRLRPEYPGTGLGLLVCRRIVERHGGRIWVESEPGAGSTFFFTIADTAERTA